MANQRRGGGPCGERTTTDEEYPRAEGADAGRSQTEVRRRADSYRRQHRGSWATSEWMGELPSVVAARGRLSASHLGRGMEGASSPVSVF
jgi:hypothetical protein